MSKKPRYRRIKKTFYNSRNCVGTVVRFDGLRLGIVVNVHKVDGKPFYPVGYSSEDWVPHTDRDCWAWVKNGKALDKTLQKA